MSNPFLDRIARKAIGAHGGRSERRVLKELGARPTPASGALTGAKSDGTLGDYRVELKSTTTAKMGIELAWLQKITKEAQNTGKIPALVFSFVTPEGKARLQSNATWVSIPEWAFLELLNGKLV